MKPLTLSPSSTPDGVHIVISHTAGADGAEHVADQLGRDVADAFGPREEHPISAVATDNAGTVVGGLNGATHWRWLYVRNLWVAAHYRGGGLGRRLLAEAEHHARARGCVGVYLDTFNPDAERFYRACGFETFGRIDDFPPGHQRRFLSKAL